MMTTFIRYVTAGGLAALLHLVVLVGLVELAGFLPTPASAIGFCMAVMANYWLQYHWTFAAAGPHRVVFVRYVLVTLAGLGINTGLFWYLLNEIELPYLIAQVLAIGVVVLFNYSVNLTYTFSNSVVKDAK